MPKSQPSPQVTYSNTMRSNTMRSNEISSNNISNSMSDVGNNQNSSKKTRAIFAKNNSDTTVKNNNAMKKANDGLGVSISEMLDTEYRGISLYAVAMMLLIIAILWTGVSVVEQIQTYHQQYGELQKLKKQFRQLQMEHQRMLIEQQTFSATPQVTNRAVTELNMFYPNLSDRMIIHDNKVTVLGNSANDATSNESSAAVSNPETQH